MMTFNLNIDAKELFDRYMDCEEADFNWALSKMITDKIANTILRDELGYYRDDGKFEGLSYRLEQKTNEFFKEHADDLIRATAELLSEKIARKKMIVEMTPKARDLAAVDKDNRAYFEELIDKAIAKRFKG